jgi:hypothetical protein
MKKMNRTQALELLHSKMQNQNLRRHCYAVEATMRSLAKRLGGDPETWGIAGLLHDADYEIVRQSASGGKEEPDKHTHLTLEWLKPLQVEAEVKDAILAHGWGYVHGNPEPQTKMEWSLYCCDELTGLIVAVALVKPDKKLASATVESVLNKWKSNGFAAGVDRSQIELCDEKLGIPLRDFIGITLTAMQNIQNDLGL